MKKILVVDDSMMMRAIIKRYLTRGGYTIAGEAQNGHIAILKYTELHPDLVTMDIAMPIMDGIEALKEIIRLDPLARVVMVSSLGQEPLIKDAVVAGAKNFVVKPFNEVQLISTVKSSFLNFNLNT